MTLRTLSIPCLVCLFACHGGDAAPGSVDDDGSAGTESTSSGDGETGAGTGGSGSGPDMGGTGSGSGGSDSGGETGDSTGTEDGEPEPDVTPPMIESFLVDGSTMPGALTSEAFVELSAEVTDDQGVDRVEFLDGDEVLVTLTDAPYTYEWLVSGESFDGDHGLRVRAYDEADNEAEAGPISLGVDMPAGGELVWEDAFDGGLGQDRVQGLALNADDGQLVAIGDSQKNFNLYSSIAFVSYATADGKALDWATALIEPEYGAANAGQAIAFDPQGPAFLGVGAIYGEMNGRDAWHGFFGVDGQPGDAAIADLGGGLSDTAYDVALLDDGDFVMVGGWRVGYDDRAFVRRVGSDGEFIWSWTLEEDGVDWRLDSVVEVGDAIYIVGAEGLQRRLWKLDADGGIAWTKDLESGTDLAANDDALFVCGTLAGDVWLAALDLDGNAQWTRTHDEAGYLDVCNGLAAGPLGGVVVGGYVQLTSVNKTRDLWAARYDAQGTKVWTFGPTDGGDALADQVNAVEVGPLGRVYLGGQLGKLDGAKNDWWVGCLTP